MPTARRTWLIASLGTYDARVWAHFASISGPESLCPEINSMVISNQTSVQCRRYTRVSSTGKRALRFVDQWITGSAVVSASSLSLRLSRRSCPSSAGGLPRRRCSGRDQARPPRQVVARRRTSAGRCTTQPTGRRLLFNVLLSVDQPAECGHKAIPRRASMAVRIWVGAVLSWPRRVRV
jgi:hypothetical protein